MKYKVGDRVVVNSKKWYDLHKDEFGWVQNTNDCIRFSEYMSKFCGMVVTIKLLNDTSYDIKEDYGICSWRDWMFEGLESEVLANQLAHLANETSKTEDSDDEDVDLCKILKHCKKRTKLYSPVFGEVFFDHVNESTIYVIAIDYLSNEWTERFKRDGRLYDYYNSGECLLFPSKEQRSWKDFKPTWKEEKPKYKPNPFDKVLGRDTSSNEWRPDIFLCHRPEQNGEYSYFCAGYNWHEVIPYEGNEDKLGKITD